MTKRKEPPTQRRGILYAVMLFLIFVSLLVCALGGIYLYHQNQGFYQAFRHQITPQFYLSAALFLIGSSTLYTPFSYGITYYFLSAQRGEARFASLFFLFCKPLLLFKAILVSIAKKICIYLERALILLAASLVEVALFLLFLLLKGEDLFSIGPDFFGSAAEFMMRSPALIVLSIALWCGVFFMMFLSFLRYVLCKYLLIAVPDTDVWQIIKIGKAAMRGHLLQTFLFYLHYLARSILAFFSLSSAAQESFSGYAERLASAGWRKYCQKRSLR